MRRRSTAQFSWVQGSWVAGLNLKITMVVRSWVLKIDADGGGSDIVICVAMNGDVIEGSR
jgi:hypothetical protein